jgi:MFS family permease
VGTRSSISGAEARDPVRTTWAVYACVLGNLIFRCASWATAVMLGLHLADLDRSGIDVPAIAISVLAGAFYIVEILGAPICGALSDRWGNRVFLLAGPLFGALSAQLMGLTAALSILAFARALEGVAVACATPSILAFLAYHTRGTLAYRGRVMGLFEIAAVAGIALGGLLAGLLWQALGVWAFTAVALLYLGSLALFMSIRAISPPPSHVAQHRLREYPRLITQPRLLRFIPAWACVNAIVGIWGTFLPFMLASRDDPQQFLVGGFSGPVVGLVFVGIGISFGLGVLLWSMAIGRLGVAPVMLAGLGALYALVAMLWLVNRTTGAPLLLHVVLALLLMAFIGTAAGFTPAALTYLAQLAEGHPAGRGTVMGLYSVFFGLGQLTGGALGGPFLTWRGADGLIILTALLATIALAAVLALLRSGDLQRQPVESGTHV